MTFTWTDDRIAMLTRLWGEGKSANVVAELMQISRNAVLGKVNRLGLMGRGPVVLSRRQLFDRACDRVIEGVDGVHPTLQEAAKALGLDPGIAQFMWNDLIARTHGGDPE